MPLAGKTVVVTGASRGLGFEFVKQLVAKGNRVIAAVRRPDDVKQHLQQLGGDVIITQLDVTDPSSIAEWAASLATSVSNPHVDVLINNAGISGDRLAFQTETAENMLKVFTVNAVGPLLVAQQLQKQGLVGGDRATLIANVTSKVGSVDDNKSGGGYAYRSSKAALNIITKSMSIELEGNNVTSTLLHPGWVMTDMTAGKGLIDAQTSVAGMLSILEREPAEINGKWHDYKAEEIPW